MLIFIDSNILCSNFRMKGPFFEVALRVGTIVLGQIVVDEVCNKYKENLVEKVMKVNNALRDLNKMLPDPPASLDEIDVEEKCNEYKDFLEMFIIESGMTVAEDYPDIKHEIDVKRALQRKKLFKADGSTGYRDYLVWQTFLADTYLPYVGRIGKDTIRNICLQSGGFKFQGIIYRYEDYGMCMEST